MGTRAREARKRTERSIRPGRLSDEQRARLKSEARYEGSPFHKKEPNTFGLTPPANPRPDKTLCDEAGIFDKAVAVELFKKALDHGLVSESKTGDGLPKQIWVLEGEHVFELMYGGSRPGYYHGYPIRSEDALHAEVRMAWDRDE